MITIRHNTYCEGELEKLLILFKHMKKDFADNLCSTYCFERCIDCDHRHICYDIDRVIMYLEKQTHK